MTALFGYFKFHCRGRQSATIFVQAQLYISYAPYASIDEAALFIIRALYGFFYPFTTTASKITILTSNLLSHGASRSRLPSQRWLKPHWLSRSAGIASDLSSTLRVFSVDSAASPYWLARCSHSKNWTSWVHVSFWQISKAWGPPRSCMQLLFDLHETPSDPESRWRDEASRNSVSCWRSSFAIKNNFTSSTSITTFF